MSRYDVDVDYDNKFRVTEQQYAHHTAWAWDKANNAFVLTLEREDESVIAVAVYSFEAWQDVFERLREARIMTLGGR